MLGNSVCQILSFHPYQKFLDSPFPYSLQKPSFDHLLGFGKLSPTNFVYISLEPQSLIEGVFEPGINLYICIKKKSTPTVFIKEINYKKTWGGVDVEKQSICVLPLIAHAVFSAPPFAS